MPKFEADIQCKSCNGTGLYVGMAERDGAAVVCRSCDGTGKFHYVFEYEEFHKRSSREDVKRVYKTAAGYCISAKDIVRKDDGRLIEFSKYGVGYKDWLEGKKPIPDKSFFCPAQWSGQQHKPPWCGNICSIGGLLSNCPAHPGNQWVEKYKEYYPEEKIVEAKSTCWEWYEKNHKDW